MIKVHLFIEINKIIANQFLCIPLDRGLRTIGTDYNTR
jgi:hypothetical protein